MAAPRPRIARRWLWVLLAIAAVVAVGLAGITWGPHQARGFLAGKIGEQLGRPASIGRIDVSPFSGRVVVNDLVVESREPGKPMLSLPAVRLRVDILRSLAGRVVVHELQLDKPSARIVRLEPSRFDFSDIVERLADRPASARKFLWHLSRIGIDDGALEFDDRVVRHVSRVTRWRLAVSDLGNDESKIPQGITLDTDFALDAATVSAQGRAKAMSADQDADATVRIDGLLVSQVLPYVALPADVRPTSGRLGAQVIAAYRPAAAAGQRLQLEGQASLDDARVADANGAERVAARRVAVTLATSAPLAGDLHLSRVSIEAPAVALGRAPDGNLDWPRPAVAKADSPASPPAVRLRIDTVALTDGRVALRDTTLSPALELELDALSVAGEGIVVRDLARPAVDGKGRIAGRIDGAATLQGDVALTGRSGTARIEARQIDAPRYVRLAGPALKATLASGSIDAGATLQWDADAPSWAVRDGAATVNDLRVSHAGRQPASFRQLAVTGLSVEPATRSIEVASMRLDGASLAARREKNGRFDLQDWYVPGDAAASGSSGTAGGGGPGAAPATRTDRVAPAASTTRTDRVALAAPDAPWRVRVRSAELTRLDLDYTDLLIAPDKRLPRVTVTAKATELTTDPRQPIPFEAAVQLPDGSRLGARGKARPVPLDLAAQVRLQRFTITHFDPYLAPYLNLTIASGQLWGSGQLGMSAGEAGQLSRIAYMGEFSANDFRAIDKTNGDDFLRWGALALPSVKVDWRPDAPNRSRIEIGDVAFVDFYARVILTAEGRLNLSEIRVDPNQGARPLSITQVPSEPGAAAAPPASAAPAAPAAPATPGAPAASRGPAGGGGELGGPAIAAPAPAAGRATITLPDRATAAAERPTVRVGTVRIASGNVNFTDLFIRPNYTANLTNLVGSISAIASDQTEPSDVLVTGLVDNDAPLEITGKINPLAPRTLIDLRAVARGFDLPRLSPYSGRWAGYAIEKGKLTANVRYKIEGDRLDAENKLVINQLTFGEKVDSPDATKLPVQLAVSLLKDRNGNIDLDLPISGTITDPQFSVGGLIWRAIGNLIVKIVTSPFTFLASLGGPGGPELSHVAFGPGEATLDDEDRKRLDALAKAMADRPGISLDLAGYADPDGDKAGLQQTRFENQLRSAKLAQIKKADPAAELPPLNEVTIDAAERPALLSRLYADARFDKPRNAVGLPRQLPPEEMESLLRANTPPVGTEEVKEVAQQRAQTARDYLRAKGGISNERLYVLAPRVAGADDKLPPARVEFALKQ